ncbi:MAG: hypothetical protein JOZ42_05490 [Acetobacteraceae bacterium]|nr:hypothetical protein [Acetobacteraceae bacterium]
MTRDEIINGLLTAVRQSEDAAVASERALDHFRPVYRAALSGGDDVRIAELYALVMAQERTAKQERAAATLFSDAVNLIYSLEMQTSPPQ